MFGFSFSELLVTAVVALVVIGPKDLPKVLRRVGRFAGKMRRMAADLRAQSGIDDALRADGLADDIAEIRKLARGELDGVNRLAAYTADDPPLRTRPETRQADEPAWGFGQADEVDVVRSREYPRACADDYASLPDDALVYGDDIPNGPLANDPLYMQVEAKPQPFEGPMQPEAGV